MKTLAQAVLEELIARTTPLTAADAGILIEIVLAGWSALSETGRDCRFGKDGKHHGRAICVPGRWKDKDWAEHDRTCQNCPLFRLALARK